MSKKKIALPVKKKKKKKKPPSQKSINAKIKSALRKVWSWYGINKKESLERSKYNAKFYKCELCECITDKPESDHITPVASSKDWNEYIDFLFEGKIQILCNRCHKQKTVIDNNNMREQKNSNKI